MKLKKFIDECRDNDVFKNLSIYIVSSWVLLQVVALIAPPLGLPDISLSYLLILILVGFPLYIFLFWHYVLRNKVNKRPVLDQNGAVIPGKFKSSRFQKLYFVFLGVISLATMGIVTLVIGNKFKSQTQLPVFVESNKIAVLNFDNNTGNANNDVIGKMATDWVLHGITQNKVGQVISPKVVDDYTSIMKASVVPSGKNDILKQYLKPSKVISGSYYINQDKLLMQCSIMDGSMSKTLISFEVTECDANAPLECIESLKQNILGYFLSKDESQIGVEETPPNFKAYQLWLEADANLGQPNYLNLIDQAIAADSNYFKPKMDKILHYYNHDDFEVADSLINILSKQIGTNKMQMNILNHLEACLRGNNKMAYKTYKEVYNAAPMDKELNSSAMVLALQFVNRPQDLDSIFDVMDMSNIDLDNCIQCEYRYFIKGMGDIELGKAEETVALLKPFARTRGLEWIKRALLKAYVKMGDTASTREVLDYVKLMNESEYWEQSILQTGVEFLMMNNEPEAHYYFDTLLDHYSSKGDALRRDQKTRQAAIFFYKENYPMVEKLYQKLEVDGPLSKEELAFYATALHKNGKQKMAQLKIEVLNGMKSKYDFGNVDYSLAQFYAIMGDSDKAMSNLLKAVAAGKRFTNSTFQNDPIFRDYHQMETFQNILRFWY
ncbi:MAG: hypothetical protein HKO09_04860 [Croceitalea sp.]|nr:hypothetical protein [Croceitalea sp.]